MRQFAFFGIASTISVIFSEGDTCANGRGNHSSGAFLLRFPVTEKARPSAGSIFGKSSRYFGGGYVDKNAVKGPKIEDDTAHGTFR